VTGWERNSYVNWIGRDLLEYNIAAGIMGGIAGILALTCFAYFVRELGNGQWKFKAISFTVSLLFGSGYASAPIGDKVLDETLWPWFVFGEGIIFLPIAIIFSLRYSFKW